MSARTALALVLGLGGLAAAAALFWYQPGPLAERVALADVAVASLDTVAVRGRHVEVSLAGIVTQVGPGDDVWLSSGGDAIALRFPEGTPIEVEDHLLAVGRLRAWRGRRWVAVASWTHVEAAVRPPSGEGL